MAHCCRCTHGFESTGAKKKPIDMNPDPARGRERERSMSGSEEELAPPSSQSVRYPTARAQNKTNTFFKKRKTTIERVTYVPLRLLALNPKVRASYSSNEKNVPCRPEATLNNRHRRALNSGHERESKRETGTRTAHLKAGVRRTIQELQSATRPGPLPGFRYKSESYNSHLPCQVCRARSPPLN